MTKTENPAAKRTGSRKKLKNPELMAKFEAMQAEHIRKIREFDAMIPDEKIAELKRQHRLETIRANNAEADLEREKALHKNYVCHMGGTLDMLKMQLELAEAKIQELEAQHESD
jgi:hypothetical protein